MSREDKLWDLGKSRLREWARIQREATENERITYKASLVIWEVHERFRVITNSYISKKVVNSIMQEINDLELEIATGAKEEEARQAVKDALEYLDLVTWGKVRQPKGECRVF